jgi:hypothetical protein
MQWIREFFPRVHSGGSVKLASHLHLMPRSITVELNLHFHMSSWHWSRLIKHRDKFIYAFLYVKTGNVLKMALVLRNMMP